MQVLGPPNQVLYENLALAFFWPFLTGVRPIIHANQASKRQKFKIKFNIKFNIKFIYIVHGTIQRPKIEKNLLKKLVKFTKFKFCQKSKFVNLRQIVHPHNTKIIKNVKFSTVQNQARTATVLDPWIRALQSRVG